MKNGFSAKDFADDEAARNGAEAEEVAEVSFDEAGKRGADEPEDDSSYVQGRWHDDALKLHEEGYTQTAIARRVGVNQSRVSRFLKRVRDGADDDVTSDENLIEPHQPRAIRQILVGPREKNEALKAFARGDFGREELMRRITL